MPELRLLFAIIVGRGEEARRGYEEYRIRFQDIATWRRAMGLPTQGMAANDKEDNEGQIQSNDTYGTHGRISWDDDQQPVEENEPLVFHLSMTPQNSQPSLPILAPGHGSNDNSASHLDGAEEIGGHRAEALLTLEGKKKIRDWDYAGTLKTVFSTVAKREKERLASRVSAVRRTINMLMCIRMPSQESAEIASRGWAVLRSLIVSALNEVDRKEFPAYDPEQQAHFLLVEEDANPLTVHRRRNLEGCSAEGVIEMLELLEARDWHDVILVASADGGWVRRLEITGEVKVFQWGEAMI